MANLNPMGITGPTSPAPYQQPGTAAPAANPAIASYAVGSNVLNVAAPLSRFVEPGISIKDDPQGTIRGHL